MHSITDDDRVLFARTVASLNRGNNLPHDDCTEPETCDRFYSETVMARSGYAEVYRDGSAVAFGRVVWEEER